MSPGRLAALVAVLLAVAIAGWFLLSGRDGSGSKSEVAQKRDPAPAAPVAAAVPAPRWTFAVERYPPRAVISEGWVPALDGRGRLIIQCATGTMQVIFKVDGVDAPAPQSPQTVRYQVDDEPAIEGRGWFMGDTIGFELFNPDGEPADQPLLRRLPSARRLRVEASATGVTPVSMTFSVGGVAEASERVRADCWVSNPSEASRARR